MDNTKVTQNYYDVKAIVITQQLVNALEDVNSDLEMKLINILINRDNHKQLTSMLNEYQKEFDEDDYNYWRLNKEKK